MTMRIELTDEQRRRLLEWAGDITRAHVDADVEPPGYDLVVSIGSIESIARAVCGSQSLDLGEVHVYQLGAE